MQSTLNRGAAVRAPTENRSVNVMSAGVPETASPDDVSRLIAARITRLDREIADDLKHVEELQRERKEWVSISGTNVAQLPRNGEAS